jgi:hypothetical protein
MDTTMTLPRTRHFVTPGDGRRWLDGVSHSADRPPLNVSQAALLIPSVGAAARDGER